MSGPLGLLFAVFLIVLGGLFVAAEFSLVSLRRPLVEERARAGERRARMVLRELSELSFTLSSAQFGITITSLGLGFVVEQAVGDTVIRPLLRLVGLGDLGSAAVVTTLAFLLSTVVQMVVAELFPKNLAISRPIGVALAVTPITRMFGIVLGPIIRIFDVAAAWMTRRVFRVDVIHELAGGRSLAELARIVSASGQDGSLSEEQTTLLRHAIELGDLRAVEVMVPRPDVRWLDADASLVDLREAARSTGHSRFPVRGEHDDEVLGTVHVKDLLRHPVAEHATTSVRAVLQEPLFVPESQSLRRLMSDLRHDHRTFAVVVDEFGGTAGVVTLEDVLEVLVGDIRDEFDRGTTQATRRLGPDRYAVRGSLRTERLEDLLGVELPDGPYETLAGYVLDRLGRLPELGDVVRADGLQCEVTGIEGTRLTELTVTVLHDENGRSGGASRHAGGDPGSAGRQAGGDPGDVGHDPGSGNGQGAS